MHEAGLMRGLMRRIEEVSAENGGSRVTGVCVWLGALSHMSAEHFAEHFAAASAGTLAAGARLKATVSDDLGHPQAQDVVLESVELEG